MSAGNSPTTAARPHRLSKWEAFDRLPFPIKEALWEAIIAWNAPKCLEDYNRLTRSLPKPDLSDLDLDDLLGEGDNALDEACARVVKALRSSDVSFCHRYGPDTSTLVQVGVPILYSRIADNPFPSRAQNRHARAIARLSAAQRASDAAERASNLPSIYGEISDAD